MSDGAPGPASLATELERSVEKTWTTGTHRGRDPAATLAGLRPRLARLGITRVANITGLDRIGLPVFTAYRPASRNLAASQGKGLTEDLARVSAIMESAELWHAERPTSRFRFASAEGMRRAGRPTVEVERMVRCPCSEYAADRSLRWVEGLDVRAGRTCWVPYEAVHCDWRLPLFPGDHSFQNGTNGLASGTSVTEAVVHGLCEVIERDSLVAFDRLPPEEIEARRLDLRDVDDDACRQVLALLEAAGIEAGVWDATGRTGVPTYTCVLVETTSPWYQPLPQAQGSGTHPDRRIALLRALTEAAQSRVTIISGARDDIFPERYAWYFAPENRGRVAGALTGGARTGFRARADHRSPLLDDDLAWLLGCLQSREVEQVVVVDLREPTLDLPVVKVIVPGLEWRPWEE
jgi:YcaO-like protein with predicted kinase domain